MSESYHIVQPPLFVLTKVCNHCNPPTEKSIDEFYRSRSEPDGHHRWCKVCRNAYDTAARHANPEKFREQEHKRVRDNAKMRAYNRKCYEKKREQRTANMREKYATDLETREKKRIWGEGYRADHPEKIQARSHHQYVTHKLHYLEKDMRRKALKLLLTIGEVDYERILAHYGRWCHICNQEIRPDQKLEFDHVIPLDRNGPHTEGNIKPSHRVCNRRKRNKLMEDLTEWDRRGP